MTDIRRIAARMATLGTELEQKGERARTVLHGWGHGPRQPTGDKRGGGFGDIYADERALETKRRARAAELHDEYLTKLNQLDRLITETERIIDVACPPNIAEVKNRRTQDLDPITAADAAAAGWCRSCWRNDQQMVPITTQTKTGLRYYRDYCKWCGEFEAAHNIEPPPELLQMRHDGRRITATDVDKAIARARALTKKSKKRKGKTAA